jgi:osmotically inducible lipoprotein OsmB
VGAVFSTTQLETEMDHRSAKICTTALLAMLTFAGCSSWSDAQKGTAIGAGAGAAIGHAVGGGVLGTVGGAAVGGVIGHEVGENRDEKKAQSK